MTQWEVRAESWAHLNDLLFEGSLDASLGRYRSRFVFRGLDDADFRLTTTLARIGGSFENLERHLLRNFRKYAPAAVVERDSDWHWVTLAQHHGLPTRIMDWSYSPQVGMHFAVWKREHMNKDGAVWVVHVERVMALAPPAFKEEWRQIGGYGLDLEALPQLVPTMQGFTRAGMEAPFAVFFEPPSIDQRIVNQYSILSALSDPGLGMDDWLLQFAEPGTAFRKVIIPKELKWEVRDKLDHLNVTERVLFPGLDGLCEWLRRYYSPKT